MENESIINKRVHDFSKAIDIVQTILVFLIAFLVPTFLAQLINMIFGETSVLASHSQFIVGSIVNTALIVSALNLKGWAKIVGVVTMPSISTILGGQIFHNLSPYMVAMIPAIWLGNYALIMAFKTITLKYKKNYFLSGVVGIIVKVAVIFGWFSLLNYAGLFPEVAATTFKTAMGYVQAVTACIGTVIAFVIYEAEIIAIKKQENVKN